MGTEHLKEYRPKPGVARPPMKPGPRRRTAGRFAKAFDELLAAEIPNHSEANEVVLVSRERLLATHILNLALEHKPQRHMVGMHLWALKWVTERLCPPALPYANTVGGVTVNVNTESQLMFANQVMQLAGDEPVNPDIILKALKDMPDGQASRDNGTGGLSDGDNPQTVQRHASGGNGAEESPIDGAAPPGPVQPARD